MEVLLWNQLNMNMMVSLQQLCIENLAHRVRVGKDWLVPVDEVPQRLADIEQMDFQYIYLDTYKSDYDFLRNILLNKKKACFSFSFLTHRP